jgi:chromosomal replication initiator protein
MITIREIQRATASHFGLKLDRMLCQRRQRKLARPRQIAMYLAAELTDYSYPQIGLSFGRDHSTIMHGCNVIADMLLYDRDIAKAVNDITAGLEGRA